MYRYKPSRERLSAEQRSEIARHAALARGMQRDALTCLCGHPESEHWSIGARECRTCEIAERPDTCTRFSPEE